MDAVNAFNHELFSLMDTKPPISRAKMISITKSAIKAIKLYKHVVQIVEKFIKKCKPEYKVPGLYVVDSIVRQSRHQFGADKDVFGPRFTKNITGTFENLCLCPTEDRSKIVRVLNLWQKNGVFKIEIIQPLLDMAAGSSGSAAIADGDTASPPSPVKNVAEPHPAPVVPANSTMAAAPQIPNPDAFAAVAQLFQSSQGQQLQQMLQTFQQPGKPQSPPPAVPTTVPPTTMTTQHTTAPMQPVEKKAAFDMKLLDRFDYDDEPEAGEEKKDETPSTQPTLYVLTYFSINFSHHCSIVGRLWLYFGHVHLVFIYLFIYFMDNQSVISLPPNGQLQGFGSMPPQPYPGMMPPMGQPLLVPPQPGAAPPPAFPGGYPPQNDAFAQHMAQLQQVRARRDSVASPKRRRSRSTSRSRRSRHRRSRSRSRERRRHSPRSRSLERRDRERERERRQKGLPPVKTDTLSVCSTTLWVGQLDKRTQQQDVACLLEEFGQIESINMIPPRGCAYIVMIHRQDAFRALQKLGRGSYKVNQKTIKIAWALNKGIKSDLKQYWDVELGVTYVPWSKVKADDLDGFKEGGMLDPDSLSPGKDPPRSPLCCTSHSVKKKKKKSACLSLCVCRLALQFKFSNILFFPAGNQAAPPPGGLLGARPGMMPLQRPPGMPPSHMQRFPMPPPHPNMPPMHPQMMPRAPPQIMHREPPPGGFGMPPPPHPIRSPFPPPGPPGPLFMRPRGPEGGDDREGGRPFRNERPGFGRDWEQDWHGGQRPFGEGRGGERVEGHQTFGKWHEEEQPSERGRWERDRDRDKERDRERRDWRRSPEAERGRNGGEERSRRPERTRERSTRWDRDDRLGGNRADEPSKTEPPETPKDSSKDLPPAKAEAPPPETASGAPSSEPPAANPPADTAPAAES
uniref:SR-related CTD-associated factor 4a n=1 Tax=Denticeps clupeoides TaxID=299321 RepID=A0AAY4E8N7_9TELE